MIKKGLEMLTNMFSIIWDYQEKTLSSFSIFKFISLPPVSDISQCLMSCCHGCKSNLKWKIPGFASVLGAVVCSGMWCSKDSGYYLPTTYKGFHNS